MVVTAIGVFVESGLKTKNFNKKFNTVLDILNIYTIKTKQFAFDGSWYSAYTFIVKITINLLKISTHMADKV